MNNFIIAQIFGIASFILGGLAILTNKKRNVIYYNTLANAAASIQYLYLGAITGALSFIVTSVRNFIFYRYKQRRIPIIFLIFIIIYALIINIITFDGIISIFPFLSVSVFSYGIWQHDIKRLKRINILVSIFSLVYDIYYMAIISAISQSVYIIIGLISYHNYLVKNKKRIIRRKKIA